MTIAVHEVSRRYANGRGVGPVTLSVRGGECVALMGPNGAGKTTLLRILATADRARSGSVEWFGDRAAGAARKQIGFAPDAPVEEGSITARQATHFWCSQWRARAEVATLVDEALSAFGLGPVADEPVAGFSFGMRRRLALAQAFAHVPQLALLDEPTAGLDPAGVDALHRVIAARAAAGRTTVVGSNDCAFVAAACERVVFLHEGQVLRDATPAEMLAEVGGARRADLSLAGTIDIAELQRVAGVGHVQRTDGMLSVELLDDSALARVVAVADGARGNLRALRLHTPDLGDSFRVLAGRPLVDEPRA